MLRMTVHVSLSADKIIMFLLFRKLFSDLKVLTEFWYTLLAITFVEDLKYS